MNDKDRELLQQILSSGGAAAQKGFAELVHWQFMDGLTTVIGCIAVLTICAFLFAKLRKWETEDDDAPIFKGLGLMIVSVIAFVAVCMAQGGLRDTFAPEGAAVYVVLHH